jgi:RHS repeat-associated protein
MTLTHRSLLALVIISFFAIPSTAQTPTGTPPFGSFGGGPDVINLANLNARIVVPVLHKAGRGSNFTYDLSYDSSVWYPSTASGTNTWTPVYNWGWTGQTQIATGYISYDYGFGQRCTDSHGHIYYNVGKYSYFVYNDAYGTSHPFPGGITFAEPPCSPSYGGSLNVTATDGSGYNLQVTVDSSGGITSLQVFSSNGTQLNPPQQLGTGAGTFTDRNGNQITVNGSGQFFDTMSSTTPVLTVAGSGTPASPETFTYTAPSGSAVYTVKYTLYSIQTNFGCSGITEYGTNGTTTADLVSEIDLPDISVNANDKYTFAYEATPGHSGFVTGRLASVTLPNGGTISYSYSGGSNGISCADGSAATLTRTTPDGIWIYAQTKGTGAASTTTITDPLGNNTVAQFQGIYATQQASYQGAVAASNLLQTVITCYNGNTTNCTSTAIVLPITQRNIFTVLPSTQQSEHDDFWNAYGAPTQTDDYDYGTAPHGPLLKKVLATYATLGNITAFRQTVTTQNGSGATVSEVNYNYDAGTRTATSGTPQHISVPAPWGNLTSINIYTSSTATLTKSKTYYDTGNPNTATDVNGGVTTYNYASGGASCYNSFATSVTEAITTLSTATTWNCTGGVQLTSVDENNHTTTTAYTDAYFWRPSSVTDPTGAVMSYCYAVLISGVCPTSPSTNYVESYLNFNSGSSTADSLTTLDGLGRTHVTQTRQGPSSNNFDSVETDYDALGRVSRVTLPYTGTAGQTNASVAGTTTTYDAMSRPLIVLDGGGGEIIYFYGNPGSQNNDVLVTQSPAPTWDSAHTKRRQLEYDGLGRLSSVCELTAGTSTWPGGSCAQSTAQTGYWTKYTYDPMGNLLTLTQNAQMSGSTQSRSYVYDWMSRMTSETVPEIGATGNGTASYTYDSDPTCGTSSGDLVKRIDAAGDVVCSTYDALHRQLTRTYPSGTYASVTPSKYFVYDAATVNGQAMSNAKARLAEAYTTSTSCSSKCTDIGLSYTLRGEPSDLYESTPHSGAYYHVTQSYWANRAPYQLGNNIATLPVFTYTLDGEGRVTSVSASSGQSPLISSTAYSTASLPTTVNLGSGSGDSDAYTYDSNTNRMTQYQFTVNGTSLTGALGWNANGTLQTQNITDGFYSADTQNCSYQYDDITRVTSASCGSAAAQTFTFDPFGNISKSGSPYSFQPTYSTSTNRMTALGSFTPTYDSNGNLLNDNIHNYAWDADGHAITVDAALSDAVSLTYDALGRMVEQNRSSTYTQIAYSPKGRKLALMNAATLQKGMVPLVGQSQAIYNSSGLLYYAHPDLLGSIRLATTPTTRAMYFDTAYAPFGETYAYSGTLDPAYTGQMNDTAHREDTAGGLYDFPVREYSIQGRWPNPDPAGVAATCPKDPQSQNRYAYVRGNPISRIDPNGTDDCDPDDPFCYDPCPWWDVWGCSGPPGGGGVGGGGGGNPETPRPFPWPLLPPFFFGELGGGGAPAPAGGVCECFKAFGWNRGWTGCSYDCSCAGVPAVAYKKCSIFSPYADESCPFYTEWNLGPGGVGGPGSLVYPPNFCGPPLLPPRRPVLPPQQ